MKKIILINIVIIVIPVLMWLYFELPKSIDDVNEEIKLVTTYEVEITGAVVFPGKYYVLENTILSDVIKYAYGFLENANTTNINLNLIVKKNTSIDVKFKEELVHVTKPINLNDSKYEDLLKVPNVSERIAINILLFREHNGGFESIEDLLGVKYIGEKTFEKIKPYFYL